MEKLRAEADMKRSKADMAAMQLKELEGKMHRSEDVEADERPSFTLSAA